MANTIQKLFLPLHRAVHWPDGTAYQHEQRRWMLERVLSEVPLDGVQTVVELGCGDGWVCRELGRRFNTVIGFDANPLRIGRRGPGRVLLVAGDALRPPIADGRVDLLLSVTVLEHLPDRIDMLRGMRHMIAPGGVMIHLVPVSMWKVLQWIGFVPDLMRKQVRGVARALAGQRKPRQKKYYQGRETNNPSRVSRRRWYQKITPRVHGEYDSNFQEFIQWSHSSWTQQFSQADLEVVQTIPLGLSSPYCFGGYNLTRHLSAAGPASIVAYVLKTA